MSQVPWEILSKCTVSSLKNSSGLLVNLWCGCSEEHGSEETSLLWFNGTPEELLQVSLAKAYPVERALKSGTFMTRQFRAAASPAVAASHTCVGFD